MNENYLEELAEIQNIEMNILKEFIRICDKNNIKYYLLEGSLLGAIRHKGMIPWDDDIDVGMFRDEYEKFLRIAPKEIEAPYIISNFRLRKGYKDYITQISHSEKFVRTQFRKKDDVMNVWIDVFVIDGMPKGPIKHFLHKYNLLFHKLIMMWSDLNHYLVTGRMNRPWYERFAIYLCRVFHFEKILDSMSALEHMDRCMKSKSVSKTLNTINFMSEYKWRTEFPIEYYGNGKLWPFGPIQAMIPDKAEDILKSIYGNYMELPPEDKRYKHSLKLVVKD